MPSTRWIRFAILIAFTIIVGLMEVAGLTPEIRLRHDMYVAALLVSWTIALTEKG